jgi:ABC-type multidrug transport system fused ATPase/permease subunit
VFEIIDQNTEARTRRALELTTDTTVSTTTSSDKGVATVAAPDATKLPLSLQHVCFTYASRPDTVVLHDVSVTLQPRTFTCLAGKSGAGKSTLVGILSGLLFPHTGRVCLGERVLLDAADNNDAALKAQGVQWLHANVGVVQQQDKSLMSGTIRENIEYGKVRLASRLCGVVLGTAQAALRDVVTDVRHHRETVA